MSKAIKIVVIVAVCAVVAVAATLAGYFGYIAANPIDAPDLFGEGVRYIAHRGLSSEYYENTEAAFIAAAESDFFFGIETDIYRTADGKYVCAHDENPFADESVTIDSLTLEQCLSLPLSVSNDYDMSGENERLCSFERYLEICAEGGKTAVIEFKPAFTAAQVSEILTTARQYLPDENILVISFVGSNIEHLSELAGEIGFMYLGTNKVSAEFYARRGCPVGLNADKVKPSYIDRIHRLGVTLSVWNVTTAEQAAELVEGGIDFITTDFDFSA